MAVAMRAMESRTPHLAAARWVDAAQVLARAMARREALRRRPGSQERNPTATPFPVAGRAAAQSADRVDTAEAEAVGLPDTQTTLIAPFETMAHVSQLFLRIPQFLLCTGVYPKIGLAASSGGDVATDYSICICSSATAAFWAWRASAARSSTPSSVIYPAISDAGVTSK